MRAARILSLVAVLLALAGVLTATGWVVFAQDGAVVQDGASAAGGGPDEAAPVLDRAYVEKLTWGEADRFVDPLRRQARKALDGGAYESALRQYVAIADVLPRCPLKTDALQWVAITYTRWGRPMDAVRVYDEMIPLLREFLIVDQENPAGNVYCQVSSAASSKDLLRRVYLYEARLYRELGDRDNARRAVSWYRALEPEYHYLRRILREQAELEGVPVAELNARESAAARLSDQAKWAWGDGDAVRAGQLADAAITSYPETGGAILARFTKARMLRRQKHHEEARALYAELTRLLADAGPESELVCEATSTTAWYALGPVSRSLLDRASRQEVVAEKEHEALYSLCREVTRGSVEPEMRAQAQVLLIASLSNEGELEEAVGEARRMLSAFGPVGDLKSPQVRRLCLKARTYLGLGLRELARRSEAAEEFRAVMDACRGDADAWGPISPMPMACFGLRNVLRETAGSRDELAELETLILANARGPYAYYADMVRAQLP